MVKVLSWYDNEWGYSNRLVELCSLWLKDNRNRLGQPQELLRLRPDLVQVVVDKMDRKIGYVFFVNGIKVPFTRDQIIHHKYPNPRNVHYGMGTLEAIVRAVDEELAQSAHVTGFFRQGAHLSGVLTVPETLGEDEFKRIQEQYQEQFAASTGTFRVLIAEGSADFKTISGTPAAIGVVDLRKLSKDEILSGFGVPEPLLGGTETEGELEQAQLILGRKMKPKAVRVSNRTTLDLTSNWGEIGFRIMPEQAEPESMKIARGRELLGAGASINESREAAGLPPLRRPDADEPLVPGGLEPLRRVTEPDRARPRPRDKPNLGPDEPHLVGGGDPTGGQLPTRAARRAVELLLEGKKIADVADELGYHVDSVRAAIFAPAHPALPPAEKTIEPVREFSMPSLPEGFEDWSGWKVPRSQLVTADKVFRDKARFLYSAVPDLQGRMVALFLEQRRATIERLRSSRSSTPRVRGQEYGGKAPAIDDVWDDDAENERLKSLVRAAVEGVGDETPMEWDPTNASVEGVREEAVELIAMGVNDTTKRRIDDQIAEGIRRHYSVDRIANGYPAEDYPGIVGVFDDATTGRVGVIARTGAATLYNLAQVEELDQGGETDEVEVYDGHTDEECREADGQIWPLEKARERALQHPNCVRTFIPVERGV